MKFSLKHVCFFKLSIMQRYIHVAFVSCVGGEFETGCGHDRMVTQTPCMQMRYDILVTHFTTQTIEYQQRDVWCQNSLQFC